MRCWDGDTCGVCAKTVCAVCAGSEGDPWDRMRYCGEKGCTAVICTGCCGDHQPVSDFGGNFREALPHLAPIVEIEKAAIENRVADKMIERPYFGKGKQADQLSRIHDTEAIEKFSLLAMGVHSCPNHLHDTTIFVPTRDCFYACAGCFTKEGTHDFCPAHLKGHQSKCPLNGTWAHMRIPSVQAIPVAAGAFDCSEVNALQLMATKQGWRKFFDKMVEMVDDRHDEKEAAQRLEEMKKRREKKKGAAASTSAQAASSSDPGGKRRLLLTDQTNRQEEAEAKAAKAAAELLADEDKQRVMAASSSSSSSSQHQPNGHIGSQLASTGGQTAPKTQPGTAPNAKQQKKAEKKRLRQEANAAAAGAAGGSSSHNNHHVSGHPPQSTALHHQAPAGDKDYDEDDDEEEGVAEEEDLALLGSAFAAKARIDEQDRLKAEEAKERQKRVAAEAKKAAGRQSNNTNRPFNAQEAARREAEEREAADIALAIRMSLADQEPQGGNNASATVEQGQYDGGGGGGLDDSNTSFYMERRAAVRGYDGVMAVLSDSRDINETPELMDDFNIWVSCQTHPHHAIWNLCKAYGSNGIDFFELRSTLKDEFGLLTRGASSTRTIKTARLRIYLNGFPTHFRTFRSPDTVVAIGTPPPTYQPPPPPPSMSIKRNYLIVKHSRSHNAIDTNNQISPTM